MRVVVWQRAFYMHFAVTWLISRRYVSYKQDFRSVRDELLCKRQCPFFSWIRLFCLISMSICTQYSKAISILCNTIFHSATTKMPLQLKVCVSHAVAKKTSLKFSCAKQIFILHSKIRNKFLMIARHQQRLSSLYERFNFFSIEI